LQDILLGANCGASCGVLVKMRKPHRIWLDNIDLSSEGSVRGSFGKNHAVTMVVLDETSGPFIWKGEGLAVGLDAFGEHETISRHQGTKAQRHNGAEKRNFDPAPLCPCVLVSLCRLIRTDAAPTLQSPGSRTQELPDCPAVFILHILLPIDKKFRSPGDIRSYTSSSEP
jgi:hypothetical protein